MSNSDCIFCKIINGEIPSRKVFETENILAFLDINPMTEGHTIIVRKNHYFNLIEMPEDEITPFFTDLRKTALFLKTKLNFDGFNVLQNNYPAAGQVVPHFHFHIIPRSKGDNIFELKKDSSLATEEALNNLYNKLV